MKQLHSLDPIVYPINEDMLHKESQFVQHFYDLIVQAILPPYAISVDGLWGTGKTTVMTLLRDKLEAAKYPVFWFNPWEYRQTENVVLAFLQCLAEKYKNELKEWLQQSGVKILRVLLEVGIDMGLKLINKNIPILALPSLEDLRKSEQEFKANKRFSFEDYENTVQILQREFREVIQHISHAYQDKPVFIFFDDLDRCLPIDAIQLLEALKSLFTTKDCKIIFICGVDTRVAKQFIKQHYNEIEEIFAINYFRKIFNLTISMPYSHDIFELLVKHVKEVFEWDDPEDKKARALAEMIQTRGLATNIFSVRKYLNVVHNFYAFLRFNPAYEFNLETDFIVNLLVLKETWQPLYENLIKEALREPFAEMAQLTETLNKRYPDQEKFLSEYLEYLGGKFKGENLSQWLLDYPTLA